MNVGGITSNYPMDYGMKRTQKTTADKCFAEQTQSVSSGQSFTLHWFDNELGEKPIGARGLEGGSATVYKPVDFDPENCDSIDMYAYACHLTDSGEFPDAQSTFMRASANPHGPGTVYDSPFDRMNWVDIVKYAMQVQYDVGNMAGYMDYKKFWDFLTQ